MAKKNDVQDIFNSIAPKYDALNHILSMNIDKSWRKKAMTYISCVNDERLLDVACGTGDFSIAAYKKGIRNIVGIDISRNMVNVGKQKVVELGLTNYIDLREGDSEDIDFEDNSFDYIIVAFGVRNFEHLELGLQEMQRVLKMGGRAIILEFSMPEYFPFKQLYKLYFKYVLPVIGGWISGDKRAYSYLPESVMKFPQGVRFLDIMKDCGFVDCSQKRLSFGIASLYIGHKK